MTEVLNAIRRYMGNPTQEAPEIGIMALIEQGTPVPGYDHKRQSTPASNVSSLFSPVYGAKLAV